MIKVIQDGSITSPDGFVASGKNARIKKSFRKFDVSLIYSKTPCVAAGTFTTNRVKAWPLLYDLKIIRNRYHRVIFANSGNANCFNGKTGNQAVSVAVDLISRKLKVPKRQIFVASTGIIGKPFPVDRIEKAIPDLIEDLSKEGGHNAARGILTTDTYPKEMAVRFAIGRKPVILAGMAKGAGMVCPEMNAAGIRNTKFGGRHATMLCFLTTDISISKSMLQRALSYAVDRTFNKVIIDNDQSTNDTVLILANGKAGNQRIVSRDRKFRLFQEALLSVCTSIARDLVRDGEGVTHVCEVVVKGARNPEEGERLCRQIASSMLFKTMLAGEDPNWGRLVGSIGASGVSFSSALDIAFGGIPILMGGRQKARNKRRIRQILKKKEFRLEINLKSGRCEERFWTTDLTKFYVWINSRYST